MSIRGMRYLLLDDKLDDSSLDELHVKIREEEFITTGRLFLSALAVMDEQSLLQLRSKIRPHELRLNMESTAMLASEQSAVNHSLSEVDGMVNTQALETFTEMNHEYSVLSSTTPLYDRELFSRYTTLEDPSPLSANADNDISDTFQDQVMSNCQDEELPSGTRPSTRDPHSFGDAMSPGNFNPKSPGYLQWERSKSVSTEIIDSEDRSIPRTFPCSNTSPYPRLPSIPEEPAAIEDFDQGDMNAASLIFQPSAGTPLCSDIPRTALYAGATPYLRALNALISIYGEQGDRSLTTEKIIRVIKAGDFFIHEGAVNLLSHSSDAWTKFWCLDVAPDPTSTGSVSEKLSKAFRCVETVVQRSVLDHVRLRMAKLLLYQYSDQLYEDYCSNPYILSLCSVGRDVSSVTIDKILEEMYSQETQNDPQTWKKRRKSLMKHKQTGRRWSVLVHYIGMGLLLICSADLTATISDTTFSDRMIEALLTYIINTYPRAVRICGTLNALSECIVRGRFVMAHLPGGDTLNAIAAYTQSEEREMNEWQDELQQIDVPTGSIKLFI